MMDDPDYEEDLKKEKKRRKRKMYGRVAGIIVMGIFIAVVTFYETRFYYLLVYYIGGFGYIFLLSYRLMKEIGKYRSLMDDMLIEGDHILKYNTSIATEIKRISINDVKRVYYNIDELPRTLYVVYKNEGDLMAENFYKTRIEDKDKFIKMMEDRNLLDREPISIETLQGMIESS